MGKKCKKCECPAGEKWAVPFADFLSLLLALFIALYALASVNKNKMEALKAAFVQIYDYTPKAEQTSPIVKMDAKPGEATKSGGDESLLNGEKSILLGGNNGKSTNQQEAAAIAEAIVEARKVLQKNKNHENITINEGEDGFTINLPASVTFKKDSAQIENADTLDFLKKIALIAKQMPSNTDILVHGYTDDIGPAKGSEFKDNWQLSSARALCVVKELMKDGIDGEKLGAVGYGQYRPLVPNDSEESRKKNRRVTISFVAKPENISPAEMQKNILDQNISGPLK